jgi:tetratricopeptide (TPR) repeat protein
MALHSGFANCNFQRESETAMALIADELLAKHQFAEAYSRYAAAIRQNPNAAAYHLGSAICTWHLGKDNETSEHLHEAIRIDPRFAKAHSTLAMWYLIHGMSEAAEQSSRIACQLAPNDPEVLMTRGNMLEQGGDPEGVCRILRQIESVGEPTPGFALLNGRMARRRGNVVDAVEKIFEVLKTGRCTDLEASALHLSASNLLDGMGQFDRAFEQALRGNSIRRVNWNPREGANLVDRNIAYFTRQKVRALTRANESSRIPVFVLGFVRSGTTLVEQILSSHPRIHGGGEMDLLHYTESGALKMLAAAPSQYPSCLDHLTVEQADGLAQSHLGPLKALNPAGERIIDKMPFNGLHLGLLQCVLPGARIIYCRRDPIDTCLSAYMTQFTHGNEFKYNQTHLGVFFRDYERLMEHWKSVLDLPILEVSYEALVTDIEGQSRRMLQFLDMPWNDRCTKFYETKRSVTTASSEQVRNRPYRSSIGRWRNYTNHIGPLRVALKA